MVTCVITQVTFATAAFERIGRGSFQSPLEPLTNADFVCMATGEDATRDRKAFWKAHRGEPSYPSYPNGPPKPFPPRSPPR